jgi:hypothetical protein
MTDALLSDLSFPDPAADSLPEQGSSANRASVPRVIAIVLLFACVAGEACQLIIHAITVTKISHGFQETFLMFPRDDQGLCHPTYMAHESALVSAGSLIRTRSSGLVMDPPSRSHHNNDGSGSIPTRFIAAGDGHFHAETST